MIEFLFGFLTGAIVVALCFHGLLAYCRYQLDEAVAFWQRTVKLKEMLLAREELLRRDLTASITK